MAIRRYSPPIERVKKEYAMMVSRRYMRKLRGPRPPSNIPDNSEPWIRDPKTIDDLCEISRLVQQTADDFLAWGNRSKIS